MILKMQVSMQELHNVLVIFLSQQNLLIVKNKQFFRKRLMLSQTRFLFSAKVFSMALVIFPFPFQSRPSKKKKGGGKTSEFHRILQKMMSYPKNADLTLESSKIS